jgi:chorismate synthase
VRAQRDSIGGIITCCIKNLPVGLGEPVFDKLPAVLAHGMLSIPAVKGFEIGSGFKGTTMNGSQHNDCFSFDEIKHRLIKQSNNSGGTLGGISDGSTVYFSVAFKPVSTIGKTQITCDF